MDTTPLAETCLDPLQIAVFKVDDNVQVSECNASAKHLFAFPTNRVLKRCFGDQIQCINSLESAEGCGFGSGCRGGCNIRGSISECIISGNVVRRRVELVFKADSQASRRKFIITVNPLFDSGKMFAILILEDLHLSLLNEKMPVRLNRNRTNYDDRYGNIIEDHLIKYRTVIF